MNQAMMMLYTNDKKTRHYVWMSECDLKSHVQHSLFINHWQSSLIFLDFCIGLYSGP